MRKTTTPKPIDPKTPTSQSIAKAATPKSIAKNIATKPKQPTARPANGDVVSKSSRGQRVGYVRVSTLDQNPERQLDSLPEHLAVDRIFTDAASGKDTARPQLEALLNFVREGDTVVVHSMDRLARNLDDLRRLVQILTHRGVKIEFLKENLSFTGEDSPMSNLLLSVMGAFAEFERALIRERQREGVALAKKRGAYKGRKKALSTEQVINLKERLEQGITKAQLARELGISRETLYQYLRALD